MPTVYERTQILAEYFKDKLDSLLENSEVFRVNNTEELVKEFNKYSEENNPYKE